MPITYDDLSRGNRWAVKWGPLEVGDIADAERVRAVLEKYRPAALMHFAAYAYVGELVEQPLLYYKNNFTATLTLLTSMRGRREAMRLHYSLGNCTASAGRSTDPDRRRQSRRHAAWLEASALRIGHADCRCVELDKKANRPFRIAMM